MGLKDEAIVEDERLDVRRQNEDFLQILHGAEPTVVELDGPDVVAIFFNKRQFRLPVLVEEDELELLH